MSALAIKSSEPRTSTCSDERTAGSGFTFLPKNNRKMDKYMKPLVSYTGKAAQD